MKRIGFIGLGTMGKPMATNIMRKGIYELFVYDINYDAMYDLVKLGANSSSSPKVVAEKSEIIITMLPDIPQVREVIFGENGVLKGAKPGTILIDMSTTSPKFAKEISNMVKEKSINFVDAPVSGGQQKAIDGTLAIMVGGSIEIFSSIKDLLLCMGKSVTYIGETGSGNVAKLANQIIVAINIAAVSEAFVFATKAGVSPDILFEAIKDGLAGSTVLNSKLPTIINRNFNPGFRIELHIKDLKYALETASDVGAPLLISSQMLEIFKYLSSNGLCKDDHSAFIKFYEKLANCEVK